MKKIFLKNCQYIDFQTFDIKKTNILVEAGKDKNIKFDEKIPEDAEIYDCQGKYVMRAFIVGHHHIYSGLATGMPAPAKTPHNFYEILKYVWWNLDKVLDLDMIRASAYAVGISAIRNGVSFIIDHHSSPFHPKGSLKTIAEVLDELGLNHLLCYEISDRDGEKIRDLGLEETAEYLSENQGLVGLHASFTLEDETLIRVAELTEKFASGIHIHVAEDRLDQDITLINYGKTVLQRLNYYGLLNSSKTILAHGIHFFDEDKEIFNKSKAFLVQNPESNLNNNVGFLDTTGLDKKRIMLGTDGMHSDMIRTAKASYFAGKNHGNPSMQEVYDRLTNNYNYLKINDFEGAGNNNLVILDYKPFTELNKDNFLGHFFFGMDNSHIDGLIVNGKFLMKDKNPLIGDMEKIINFTQEQAKRLWKLL